MEWIEITPETMPEPHRQLIVTNNINARDAHGEMSHMWLVRMIHPPGDEPYYTAYNSDMTLLHGITHYVYAPSPPTTKSAPKPKILGANRLNA